MSDREWSTTVPSVASKEVRQLLKKTVVLGATFKRSGNNHVMIKIRDEPIIMCPGTPSDHRSMKNVRGQLRRAGLDL
jgi:hypothetical protein